MADGIGASPQFETAEFKSQNTNTCGFCGLPLSTYYRLNGKMACENCAKNIQNTIPSDSGARYMKAVLLGLVGVVIGMAIYATVVIATGWTIGYLALAVGFIVAKLMMVGSGGIGGRKYQITAVILTYIAISVSAIPVFIAQYVKEKKAPTAVTQPAPKAEAPAPAAPAENDATAQQGDDANVKPVPMDSTVTPPSNPKPAFTPKPQHRTLAARDFAIGIAFLLGIGLVSPFLELKAGAGGFIGLIILFVGLQIAWKIAAGKPLATVEGPYTV